MKTSPERVGMRPEIVFNKADLPLPLLPINKINLPLSDAYEISETKGLLG